MTLSYHLFHFRKFQILVLHRTMFDFTKFGTRLHAIAIVCFDGKYKIQNTNYNEWSNANTLDLYFRNQMMLYNVQIFFVWCYKKLVNVTCTCFEKRNSENERFDGDIKMFLVLISVWRQCSNVKLVIFVNYKLASKYEWPYRGTIIDGPGRHSSFSGW